MATYISVERRVAHLRTEHGTYRAAGKAIGMTYTALWKYGNGKLRPGRVALRKLGLCDEGALYPVLTTSRKERRNKTPGRK